MKRHLLGFFVACLAFSGSFYVSPIRFTMVAMGHGYSTDGADWCSYYPHVSTYFVPLSTSMCNYGTNEAAINNVNKKAREAAEIIEPAREIKFGGETKIYRAVILLREGERQGFCIIRADKEWVTDICSPSLRHVSEFESQKFPEK
jgi:hypothetical protein